MNVEGLCGVPMDECVVSVYMFRQYVINLCVCWEEEHVLCVHFCIFACTACAD